MERFAPFLHKFLDFNVCACGPVLAVRRLQPAAFLAKTKNRRTPYGRSGGHLSFPY